MLRIYRCKYHELTADAREFINTADRWVAEINTQLGKDYSSIIGLPKADGEFVNYYTNLGGKFDVLDESGRSRFEFAFNSLDEKRQRIVEFLNSSTPLVNSELEASRKNFASLIAHSDKNFVIENINPVSCAVKLNSVADFESRQLLQAAAANAVPPVIEKKCRKGCGCLLASLLLLLLLALLALWFFLLRPWPMEGTLKDRILDLLGENDKALVIEDLNKKLSDQEEASANAQAEADARLKALEEEKARAEEEAKAKAEEDALRAKEEELKAQAEAEKLKAELEAAKIALEAEKQKALEEAKKLAAQQQAQAKAKSQAQAPATKKNEDPASDAAPSKKKVPKCKELMQKGQMPQMAIAFDGSESMLIDYGAGDTRLSAAKKSATKLVNSTDKNISIGFVEINGCPASKTRGFYGPGQRGELIRYINNVNPYKYDGRTPLVNGLISLSKMLDGVNSEAVGILISDGEDTCPMTENVNLCSVAQKIHKEQPKLKIHTILIGNNVDSAACVARITGGNVYKPKDAVQIQQQLQDAGSTLKKVCEE